MRQETGKADTEPTLADERAYHRVRAAKGSVVRWGWIRFRIGWMRPYTLERVTEVAISGKADGEIPPRVAALILLNGFFRIKLLYPILWRWLYHCVPSNVVMAIVAEGKKKGDSLTRDYWACIVLAAVMRDSRMSLNATEANRFLREHRSERHGR